MKKNRVIILLLLILFPPASAQSKFSLTPGLFYNGAGFGDKVNGFGGIIGLEYQQGTARFFSLELRTKYACYLFDDGTRWREDKYGNLQPPVNPGEARLEYTLFSPQAGLVPKFHFYLDESLSFFVENEFSLGLISGRFRYKGFIGTKRFTEPIFSYNVGAGIGYKLKKGTLLCSVGYSTLNFREKIYKHRPANYREGIPNQDAVLWVNLIFKIPLSKTRNN